MFIHFKFNSLLLEGVILWLMFIPFKLTSYFLKVSSSRHPVSGYEFDGRRLGGLGLGGHGMVVVPFEFHADGSGLHHLGGRRRHSRLN